MIRISGDFDPAFRPVADAFVEGFESGRDVGAALTVMVGDRTVLDVWHGHADRRRTVPWGHDTLVCMFSVTKAMTAVCLLQAVDRGLLELDEPVATYWPELTGGGKDAITLRHLLCHQAGLVGFHDPVDRDIVYDWPRFVAALEREWTWWEPGERHGYHARTFGFLLGETLRRASGRTPGQWFREEIAGPLDLDFAIGVNDTDLDRCADMLPARMRPADMQLLPPGTRDLMRDFNDTSTPTGAAFQNPAAGAGERNSKAFRTAENPAASGHGTARAAAGMYHAMGSLLSQATLREATSTHALGADEVLKSVSHFGLGFMLHHQDSPIGIRPGTFGHAGAGGAMAFHDPEANVSFCFAMNQMEMGVVTGGRSATATARAVYECV